MACEFNRNPAPREPQSRSTASGGRQRCRFCAWILTALPALAGCTAAQPVWELHRVGNAAVRLRVPSERNGTLVIAAGGYAPEPGRFEAGESPGAFADRLVEDGYMYAESGYSSGGLGLTDAVADVRALHAYMRDRYGSSRRTFIIGESKGGLVAAVLMEAQPPEFDGGLAFTGLLATPFDYFERAAGLLRKFHDAVPGLLPAPEDIPETFVARAELIGAVLTRLEREEQRAAALRMAASVRTNEALAELLVFHAEALADLQRRCGSGAFRPTTPDASASACVKALPSPTGQLTGPLIAVDTAYDPVIPPWASESYERRVEAAGRGGLFVRTIVPSEGHLNVPADDRRRALRTLEHLSETASGRAR